jgi:LAO/AO transport system kinase
MISTNDFLRRIHDGDRRALAQAATLIENETEVGRALIRELSLHTGRALVVGITGPPGVGKSTLVDQLIRHLRLQSKQVAVLAVDPSSQFSGGAILGDRIRMQEHSSDQSVFIRSMASRGQLGGLAAATSGLAVLLDAAGFDVVLIETVGVGQDEVDIAGLADITVVVLAPGAGDDVQAIKAGILEIADVFAVNKSDLAGADLVVDFLRAAQTISSEQSKSDRAPICLLSAAQGEGVDALWNAISSTAGQPSGAWHEKAKEPLGLRAVRCPADSSTEKSRTRRNPLSAGASVEIDHIGVAVDGLESGLRFYQDLLGMPLARRETVQEERVQVAMLPAGTASDTPRIELLEAADETSPIARFIARRGPGLHHIALRVADLSAAVERLKAAGAVLLNEPRPGAGGHTYVFVHPKSAGGVLLELIQK